MNPMIALYVKNANECDVRSKQATDEAIRAEWAELTAHWHLLADSAERLLKTADDEIEFA